jgi:hypothetical protein
MTNPIRRRVERLEAAQPSSTELVTCIQLCGVVPGGGEGPVAVSLFDHGRWTPFAMQASQCPG